MANINEVEETWRSFAAQTLRLLEELQSRQETTDASYISLACDRLSEALKSVNFLSGALSSDQVLGPDLLILLSSLQDIQAEWERKLESTADKLLSTSYGVRCVVGQTGPGRPRFDISEEQLSALRELGLSWTDISALLGVSRVTVYRRRRELGLEESRYTEISEDDLDAFVAEVVAQSPDWGERLIMGSLRHRRITIQRQRLRECIRRVDPVNRRLRWLQPIRRRPYSVRCPNALWHIDSYMKLIRWGMVVHGGIDGFSRMVVYLHCSLNNRAETVLEHFQRSTAQYGTPSRVRCDYGGENNSVEVFMLERRGEGRGTVLRGSSVHNQRIERLWRDVFRSVAVFYYRLFHYLERQQWLDLSDSVDLFSLHFVYLRRINRSLHEFQAAWNSHSVRTARGQTPRQLFVAGMLTNAYSSASAVDALSPSLDPSVIAATYGIDWDGPVPNDQHDSPPSSSPALSISPEDMQRLEEDINIRQEENYGVEAYLACKQTLREMGY